MCLQCPAEAQTLVADILPGYSLMVARKDTPKWPQGYYGLVRQNDPDFVWPGPLLADPLEDLSDEEIDALPEDDPRFQASDRFHKYTDQIESAFISDPLTGYAFVSACMAAGYDSDRDGSCVLKWFSNLAARRLAQLDSQPVSAPCPM